MTNMLKDIDSKTITSAGGIVLAALAIWALFQIAGSRFDTLSANVAENTKAILELAKQVQVNTTVVQPIQTTKR